MARGLLSLIPMPVRLTPTRSGQPNVEVDGVPYHSPYNPQREAEKFYASYPINKADVILHFGWGLGYAAEILRRRLKETGRILVFEPDEDLFRLWRTQDHAADIVRDRRFQFIVGSQICRFFDSWTLEGCQDTDEFLWLTWPQAAQKDPALLENLTSSFRTRLRDRAANLLTHFENGRVYFENVLANFDFQRQADAGSLFNRFGKIPLVLVSAGPSLDRNIRDLRGMENRCFILAVDTALRPLLSAGIVPHPVIIADPTELNARHVVGSVPAQTYLIAEQAVHITALQAASRSFIFGLGLFPDSLFEKFGFANARLEVWGSVATAALNLAIHMGADPIIFAGQDFAYSWGRDYARHTIFEGNQFDAKEKAQKQTIDIWGRSVHSTENLIAYRDFFVRKIAQTPQVRFINATEGGILQEGVEILPLRHALHQYCVKPINAARTLDECYRPKRVDIAAIKHLAEILQGRNRDCECLSGFLELTAKEHLLKRDEDGVNESILWGWRACEEFYRTHAESRAPLAHRGHARAGVDV